MNDCKKRLQAKGETLLPRSCARCGLGACQDQDFARQDNSRAALKQIAGLIQKLSYRDMQSLAETVNIQLNIGDVPKAEMASVLLRAADALLAEPVTVAEAAKAYKR